MQIEQVDAAMLLLYLDKVADIRSELLMVVAALMKQGATIALGKCADVSEYKP